MDIIPGAPIKVIGLPFEGYNAATLYNTWLVMALLFLLEQRDQWTLSLGLQQLDSTEVPKTTLMAGSVIISVPVIILFFLAERFMTEGLTAGGVKG